MGRSGWDKETRDRSSRKRSRSRSKSRSRSPSSYKYQRSKSPNKDRSRDKRDEEDSRRADRKRERDRSRDRERDRDKDRERNRERDRDRNRDRDFDRDRDKDRDKVREKSPEGEDAEILKDIVGVEANHESFDKDAQQQKLEILMQQRREKVEKWRAEQAKKKESQNLATTDGANEVKKEETEETEETKTEVKKKWTLDDEFDGDDEEDDCYNPQEEIDDSKLKLPEKKEEVEDVITIKKPATLQFKNKDGSKNDPAKSTKTVQEAQVSVSTKPKIAESKFKKFLTIPPKREIPKIEKKKEEKSSKFSETQQNGPTNEDVDPLDAYMEQIQEQMTKLRGSIVRQVDDKKVSVVVGVAKRSDQQNKKGELLEQNQDALEYSSEDEMTSAEDLTAMNNNLQNQVNKTKKLLTITKEDITYIPFRKNFYIEVPELAKMTPQEVEAYREELEGIKVKGKGCPKPIKTWAQAGVSKKVMDILKKHGYEKPTPIQCQAIPAIMSGRDIIGIAKTGSGKTLAFLIPMIRHILDQPELEPGDGPIALIMSPTRELATQIWAECRKFAKPLGLRTVCVYGGTPISEQIGELKQKTEIVVCTPGRMIDMLAANGGRVTNLRRCTYIVLDEADRMFDMGFEPQVMRIIDNMRPDRQTVMFSATFPRIMEALARRILTKPIEIQVGGRSVVCKDVEQHVVVIEEEDKFLKLLELLGQYLVGDRSAIVFVDKQENADILLKELMHASYTCLALHGGIDQQDRDSTISDFKNNRIKVLIATSVAARGLDVKYCYLAINYDCPNHYEDYVHRCGRTGRAGNKGFAWTFITRDQARYAGDIIKALEQSGYTAPEALKNLFNSYKEKLEQEGKKVKSSSGFYGKGFKFDEAEAQLANEKKKFQKAALGIQDSDDEDVEADIDQEIVNMLAPKKTVKQIAKQTPVGTAAAATSSLTTPTVPNPIPDNANAKLELAKKLASRIKVAGGKTSSATQAFLKGESTPGLSSALSAKSIAEAKAERINAKLNYVPKDSDYNEDGDLIRRPGFEEESDHMGGEVFQRFEEELEINDFPQQARWRVTSKEALAQISEYSEAGITVRGTFIAPGQQRPISIDGKEERKLYLAIEGTSEISVKKARDEIIRLIKEEIIKLQNSYQPINKGRYKVI